MKISKRVLFIVIVLCVFSPGRSAWTAGTCNSTTCSTGGTSPWTAESAAYADVHHCVNTCAGACTGDTCPTVIVPAGSANWNSSLTITGGITLQGAGIDKTVIKAGKAYGGFNGIINIMPEANEPIRITGFTFDGNLESYIMYLRNDNILTKLNKIRIDHNKMINSSGRALMIAGTLYGVIDNNIVSYSSGWWIGFDGLCPGATQWDHFTQTAGTADSMFYEDNTITASGNYHANGCGGRAVARYNTFLNVTTGGVYAMDAHGNQGVTYENNGTMLTEIYGNSFDFNFRGGRILDHRGGKGLLFDNWVKNAGTASYLAQIREEYADDLHGRNYLMHVTDTYYWSNRTSAATLLQPNLSDENCCVTSEAWQANHDYGSYYCSRLSGDPNGNCWRTIDNWTPGTTGPSGSIEPDWQGSPDKMDVLVDGNVTWLNMGQGTPIFENTDFFTQRPGVFDGTGLSGGGVGCGTLADRPATCTPGVGYWATDQSCTDLTGRVGANPATPTSGILYKCNTGGQWEAFYTPYTYPHPLRAGDDTTPPAAPGGFNVH